MSIDNSKQAAPVSALADVVKYTRLARGIQNPAGAYPNGPWEDFYACDDVVRALAASQPSPAPVAMTDEQISKAARHYSNKTAESCGVDPDDQWMIYGQEFVDDFRAAILAAKQEAK